VRSADLQLYILPCGACDLHESVMFPDRQSDRRVQGPSWAYLVRSPAAVVLIDTGMPPECVHGGSFASERIVPLMTEADVVTARLGELGLAPGDVDLVVNTHLHFDHAGGNRLFPEGAFLLQRAEYEQAARGSWCAFGRGARLLDGDAEIVPGLEAIFTPGHSPGHMSLLVRTRRDGPILLTIDASYTAETFDPERMGAMWDAAAGAASVRRLREIARAEGARVFFGHDGSQAATWRTSPACYR
jgi:N-acyl homoserine lactone hydrolase